jgi:hypothetical protein
MVLFDDNKRRFYFRCENGKCSAIFSSEFDNLEDIRDVQDEELYLECECGERASLMWD